MTSSAGGPREETARARGSRTVPSVIVGSFFFALPRMRGNAATLASARIYWHRAAGTHCEAVADGTPFWQRAMPSAPTVHVESIRAPQVVPVVLSCWHCAPGSVAHTIAHTMSSPYTDRLRSHQKHCVPATQGCTALGQPGVIVPGAGSRQRLSVYDPSCGTCAVHNAAKAASATQPVEAFRITEIGERLRGVMFVVPFVRCCLAGRPRFVARSKYAREA